MNINKITLMGRLTADPELKMSQSNVPVLRFTVAVNRKATKNDQNERPAADFIDCVCFYQTAEFVDKYFRKGSVIIVFGSLQIDTWKDKNGNNQRSPKVMVDEVQFGESKTVKTKNETIENAEENKEVNLELDLLDLEEELPF